MQYKSSVTLFDVPLVHVVLRSAEYALGGVAVAAHANDQAARAYFESGDFLGFGDTIVRSRDWIIAAAAGLAALIFTSRRGSDYGRV
jgi:hypothetical protein